MVQSPNFNGFLKEGELDDAQEIKRERMRSGEEKKNTLNLQNLVEGYFGLFTK